PTSAIYTLSLHDALPISREDGKIARRRCSKNDKGDEEGRERDERGVEGSEHLPRGERMNLEANRRVALRGNEKERMRGAMVCGRSEEHTSELQSRENLVC